MQDYANINEDSVVALAQAGDGDATEFLLDKYKNLVRSMIRAYFLIGADSEDLLQEGMIGLYKAVRDYDPIKCSSFYTFAAICIKRQMITALKTATRQKHMPLNSYVSLNKPIYKEDSESTLMDVWIDQEQDPETLLLQSEEIKWLKDRINIILSDFEKQVVKLYLEGSSYQQIAKELERSPKSIDNALQRIKHKLEQEPAK